MRDRTDCRIRNNPQQLDFHDAFRTHAMLWICCDEKLGKVSQSIVGGIIKKAGKRDAVRR